MVLADGFTWATWNIAEGRRPPIAPASWTKEDNHAAITSRILERAPAVIAIQESPAERVPISPIHRSLPAAVRSHRGYVTLLLHEDFPPPTDLAVVNTAISGPIPYGPRQGYAVIAWFGTELAIASIHLAPLAEESMPGVRDQRHAQLAKVLYLASERASEVLILGDSNMRAGKSRVKKDPARDAATREIERAEGLGLLSPKPPVVTTNLYLYHEGPPRAHYSRYFHTAGIAISAVDVYDEVITRDEVDFAPSDHHLLSGWCQGVSTGQH